jgi:hypothetical protein
MVPTRDAVNIRLMGAAFDASGRPTDELYAKQGKATVSTLLWWTRVTKDGRAKYPLP